MHRASLRPRSFRPPPRQRLAGSVLLSLCVCLGSSAAQRRPMDVPDATHSDVMTGRTRLILKDGSYQLVLSYKVTGNVIHYRSAERDGAPEEIPLALVDLPATEKWAREHGPDAQAQAADQPPIVSPELQKEEADRAARQPFVAPNLRLPEDDSVLALDTFEGTTELVPLPQENSDLNHETAHTVQNLALNPAAVAHRIETLRGMKADIQLHVADPVFFVRVGSDEAGEATGHVFTVDTGAAPGRATPSGGSASSTYLIERLDVRYDSRVLSSFRIDFDRPQPDVIPTRAELLPGGHWLKLVPAEPLLFGEYALVEVLGPREVNLNVWAFGVHPQSPENAEAIRPETPRPATLERRRP